MLKLTCISALSAVGGNGFDAVVAMAGMMVMVVVEPMFSGLGGVSTPVTPAGGLAGWLTLQELFGSRPARSSGWRVDRWGLEVCAAHDALMGSVDSLER